MKLFILLFSIILIDSLQAQVTLTKNNSPSVGDIQRNILIDTTGHQPGSPGPNRVWTFSNFIPKDTSSISWILPAGTPAANEFPDADIVALDTCHNYYNKDSIKFEMLGFYSHNKTGTYNNFQTIYTYPFGYNSSFNDTFSGVLPSSSGDVYRTGTVQTTGDAWGTINLPFGTFNNALRVKHLITIRDSMAMLPAFITTFTIYEWYVPGKKFYVFSILNISMDILGSTYNFKNVTYNSTSSPIGIELTGTEIPSGYSLKQNYPNPFNPVTNVEFDIPETEFVTIKVFDTNGRVIKNLVNETLQAGSYKVSFDGLHLTSGIYYCRMKSGNYHKTNKMMLVK